VEILPEGKGFQVDLDRVDDAIYDKSADQSVRAINAAVELCVRKCPEQYQWSYKRFQVQPDGKRSIYSRRHKSGSAK
jgi:KDO2-lipid IV(A) lauroyltransferase